MGSGVPRGARAGSGSLLLGASHDLEVGSAPHLKRDSAISKVSVGGGANAGVEQPRSMA